MVGGGRAGTKGFAVKKGGLFNSYEKEIHSQSWYFPTYTYLPIGCGIAPYDVSWETQTLWPSQVQGPDSGISLCENHFD